MLISESTMTEENLKKVAKAVNPDNRINLWKMWIPPARIDAIMRSYPEVDSQTEHFVGYIITYSPFAVWSKIAQGLYEKVKGKHWK